MSIFQQLYVNISTNVCQYFSKNINISTKLCQYFKKMSIFQQIYVIISNKCQYFIKFMSNRCPNPPWRGGLPPWGLAGILSAPVQKFRLYIDICFLICLDYYLYDFHISISIIVYSIFMSNCNTQYIYIYIYI